MQFEEHRSDDNVSEAVQKALDGALDQQQRVPFSQQDLLQNLAYQRYSGLCGNTLRLPIKANEREEFAHRLREAARDVNIPTLSLWCADSLRHPNLEQL